VKDRREKLNIAFYVTCDYEEEQFGEVRIGQAVRSHGISDIQALRLIVDTMRQFDMEMKFADADGKQFSVDSFLKRVEKQGRWGGITEAGGLSFSFGGASALNNACIYIEEKKANSAISWDAWVAPFLAIDGFVQAWITDVEYDYWQNAKDPLLYELEGRNYSHLPTKSNGLPPPVERLEIDTSNNPGRWSFQSGFIEAIGSIMWLSPLFWQLVGADCKNTELSASGFNVQHEANSIIKVIAADHCFCNESTESVQRKLRSVLYD